MLSARDIYSAHGNKVLFDGVHMELGRGEVKGLSAPNGFGKTTLLNILAGSSPGHYHGHVEADGIAPSNGPAFRRAVYFAPDNASSLCGFMTVKTCLSSIQQLWKSSIPTREAASTCGVEPYLDKRISTLSKGARQKASLAAAYISNAPYVLLDEPFNALDPTSITLFARAFERMAHNRRGVLLSSHFYNDARAICTSIIFIKNKTLTEVSQRNNATPYYVQFYTLYNAGGEHP